MKTRAPVDLNGEQLRIELAAAGVDVGPYDFTLRPDTDDDSNHLVLDLPTVDDRHVTTVHRVVAAHVGIDTPPALTVDRQVAVLLAAIDVATSLDDLKARLRTT